jgi:formamidopyrimidine-DNA glycosylase
MPELPEVEIIKLGLQKYLIGHKIEDIEILNSKSFEGSAKEVIGAKVLDIKRFGKGLVVELSNGKAIAIHVKMTGQLIFRSPATRKFPVSTEKVGELPGRSTRVIFKLDKGSQLFFNDTRKFGWIKIIDKNSEKDLPFFKNLGPEPFKDLNEKIFLDIIAKSKLAIKLLIMDQSKIAGVGNIYANDALFEAKIDPRRPANSLSLSESKKLFNAILSVMEKSLRYGGSSQNTYVNVLGQDGEYQRHTLVYGKKDKACPRCGNSIIRITLGGRGTFFCPNCQK